MGSLSEKIRTGAPLPLPLDLLLRTLTPVQRAGMWLRLQGARTRVPAQVISFGNLSAGGTGKTPAVIERAARELAAGRRVAVLTRGYGSENTPEPWVVAGASPPASADAPLLYRQIGDEAALMLRRLPGLTVVKAANRVRGAEAALKAGCDTLLLDDGFQAVALERDENILMVDAANPFGNGHLLPRGILREPLSAARRATEIILTRCDQARDLEELEARLRSYCPDAPIRRTRHAPTGLWRVCDGEELPLETLRGQDVTAACAIARPEAFFHTLEELGANLRTRHALPDHAELPLTHFAKDTLCVVTEKDAVRLQNPGKNVLALAISLEEYAG